MKEQIFCYCEKTETIRLMPSNYLIAYNRDGRWICEPDLAAPEIMAAICFKALLRHEIKYGTGIDVLAAITPNKDFLNKLHSLKQQTTRNII